MRPIHRRRIRHIAGLAALLAISAVSSSLHAGPPTSQPATRPTAAVRIVLAGDSTVTDNAGWGKGFADCLGDDVQVTNLSKGGRASGSFVKEGRWQQTLDLKPDYVLVQFGHNDEPGHGDRTTDPATTFRGNMVRYVDEGRAAGIKVILVTPLGRRQWTADGKIRSSLTPYADVVREIAKDKDAPLVDLHARSIAYYETAGKEGILEISPLKNADPNSKNSDTAMAKRGYDGTHLNAKGGQIIGKMVATELAAVVPDLASHVQFPAK